MPKRTTIAPGIYEDKNGRTARVTIGSGKTALQDEERFPRLPNGEHESLRVIKAWQRVARDKLEQQRPRAVRRGTFDADVDAYLRTLADRPELQAWRRGALTWIANYTVAGVRFGDRRRYSLTAAELKEALVAYSITPIQRWPTRPPEPPSRKTVLHVRIALSHLWNTLDGKAKENPLRDVVLPSPDDPLPRAIPYDIIDAIFDAMPERGQGLKGQARTKASKTKVRLQVMAYVGIPPAQLMKLKREHVNDAGVLVTGRKKGKGTKSKRLPLIPQGRAAIDRFFALHATGPFSTSSARQSWRRGVQTVVDRLAATDWRMAKQLYDALADARPYDLRHSYLTEFYLVSGDIKATQDVAMHTDARTTERYTLAAVDPRLQAVATQLGARMIGRGRSHPPDHTLDHTLGGNRHAPSRFGADIRGSPESRGSARNSNEIGGFFEEKWCAQHDSNVRPPGS